LSGHYRVLTLAKNFALKTLLNVVGFVRVSKGKDPGQDWVRRDCPLPSRHRLGGHKPVAKEERPLGVMHSAPRWRLPPSINPTNPTMAGVFSVNKGFLVVGFQTQNPTMLTTNPTRRVVTLVG
jgi:hypothetical protein